jgi:hypothetical protein
MHQTLGPAASDRVDASHAPSALQAIAVAPGRSARADASGALMTAPSGVTYTMRSAVGDQVALPTGVSVSGTTRPLWISIVTS